MSYDVAVIGSGAAGSAVAYTLTQAGYRVALIEKGAYIRREDFTKDEIAYCRRELVTPNYFDEYHLIEQKTNGKWVATPTYESGWSFFNGTMVGGSSNLMSGMFHRMHPDDFRLRSRFGEIEGAEVADWPIDYDDLAPYYDLAERLVGISGDFRPHPFEPPRKKRDFPFPPTQENAFSAYFDTVCKREGVTPLVTPRAVLSQDHAHRKACYYSNFCGSYGCSSGAKGSGREAFVVPAMATGRLTLLTRTHVVRLHTDRPDRVAYAETVDTLSGKKGRVEARLFVVAAQAHESVRLLLNSANAAHPKGLANSSGRLGKHLVFSAGGAIEGTLYRKKRKGLDFDALMQPGLFVNRSILDWYFLEDWWHGRYKGGLVEVMFEHQNIISRALKRSYRDDGKLLWGDALARKLRREFTEGKRIRFEIFNDWLPNPNCYVTTDPAYKDRFGMPVGKLRIGAHPHDMKVARRIAEKCRSLMEALGAEEIVESISPLPPQNLIAGGCRFGNDPRTSVLNAECQTHDIPNLFVADASFMPTGGSTPYTWTIYANALRVADRIVEKLEKKEIV